MNILKTVLSAGLGLGLSLSGVEVLAAEESRPKASKPSVMKHLFSFKDKKYRPNISFSGFYGQNDGSYGSLDMLYPIHQKNDRLVFVDLRGLLKKSPVKEFNVGGGYRWLSSDKQKLYGAYGFFDRKMSENNNWFNQLTIGGELKTEQLKVLGLNTKGLSIGGNVYLPVGTKSYEVDRKINVYNAWAKPYQADKFTVSFGEMTYTTIDTEYALTGIDFEVGHAIPKVKGLKAYLGGYYFSHSKVDKVMGPRATLIYDLSPLMPKKLSLIDHLELETSIQNDKPRGTTWYAGLRLQMQLGSSKDRPKLKGLEKQLTAFVRRDLDVVDQEGREFDSEITAEAPWLKENGQPYVGKIVSTEAELKELAQGLDKDVGAVDIIGVRGVIEVEGNAVPIHDPDDAATMVEVRAVLPAISLNYGQSITGQGLTFIVDGKTYTAKIVNSDQGILGADPSLIGDDKRGGITLLGSNGKVGHLLRVYTDNTGLSQAELETRVQRIEDLILRVPNNGQGEDKARLFTGIASSVIVNSTGSMGTSHDGNEHSFGHVVIDNIDANSNVRFRFLAEDKTGKLRVTASKFTVKEIYTGYAGMVSITSDLDNGLVIESIDNNELVSMSAKGLARGIFIGLLNGPVVNNHFGSITGTSAIGIELAKLVSGSVSDNTFSSIIGGDVAGIKIGSVLETATGTVNIQRNKFELIEATGVARGIRVELAKNNINIQGNRFERIESKESDVFGVLFQDIESNVNDITVSQNIFSTIMGLTGNNAYGVYVDQYIVGLSVDNNTFTQIHGKNATAGIYIKSGTVGTFTGNLGQNKFADIYSAEASAYGVYIHDDLIGNEDSTGMIKNEFTVSSAGGSAYGIYVNGDRVFGQPVVNNNIFHISTSVGNAFGIYKKDDGANAIENFLNNGFNVVSGSGTAFGYSYTTTISDQANFVSGNTFNGISEGDKLKDRGA